MKETKKDNQVILKEKKDLNKKGEESESSLIDSEILTRETEGERELTVVVISSTGDKKTWRWLINSGIKDTMTQNPIVKKTAPK